MQLRSTDKKFSRYVQGGQTFRTDVRLKWWERRKLEKRDTDLFFEITPKYAGRPDLIAFDVYNNVALNWLVLQYNTIMDINLELIAGKTIRLPTPERVIFDIINQTSGGTKE